jgi:hypothetical protein
MFLKFGREPGRRRPVAARGGPSALAARVTLTQPGGQQAPDHEEDEDAEREFPVLEYADDDGGEEHERNQPGGGDAATPAARILEERDERTEAEPDEEHLQAAGLTLFFQPGLLM